MRFTVAHIGSEFMMGDRRFRVTDVGTRTILAIRVDENTIRQIVNNDPSAVRDRIVGKRDAEEEGLFRGPPYTIFEHAFDEDTIPECIPIARWMFFEEE